MRVRFPGEEFFSSFFITHSQNLGIVSIRNLV